jgi:hypothetical protein
MNKIELKPLKVGECIRQGDVLVVRCKASEAQGEELPREGGRVVLAHGEVTGHAHAFSDPGVCMLRAEGISDRIVTIGLDGATLAHEEHAHFVVPKGTYRVRIQREWSGALSRQVAD